VSVMQMTVILLKDDENATDGYVAEYHFLDILKINVQILVLYSFKSCI
jgi:hypothetical protein